MTTAFNQLLVLVWLQNSYLLKFLLVQGKDIEGFSD